MIPLIIWIYECDGQTDGLTPRSCDKSAICAHIRTEIVALKKKNSAVTGHCYDVTEAWCMCAALLNRDYFRLLVSISFLTKQGAEEARRRPLLRVLLERISNCIKTMQLVCFLVCQYKWLMIVLASPIQLLSLLIIWQFIYYRQ